MALAILKSFYELGSFEGAHILEKFLEWLYTEPKDVGFTTHSSLTRNEEMVNESEDAEGTWHLGSYQFWTSSPQNAANGALMRNGVIPLLTNDISQALDWTIQHSIITHYSIPAVLPCIVQTILIHRALQGNTAIPTTETIREILLGSSGEWFNFKQLLFAKRDEISHDVVQWLERVGGKACLATEEAILFDHLAQFETFDPYNHEFKGIAWSVISMKIALWDLFHTTNENKLVAPRHLPSWTFEEQPKGYESVVFVCMIGADADTYGAIAGPMLAAYYPVISCEWVDGLLQKNTLDVYANALF